MLTKLEAALTPHRRRFLYRVGWVTTGVLTLHQVISAEEAAFYLAAVTSLLGMADRNVSDIDTEALPHWSSKKDVEPTETEESR